MIGGRGSLPRPGGPGRNGMSDHAALRAAAALGGSSARRCRTSKVRPTSSISALASHPGYVLPRRSR